MAVYKKSLLFLFCFHPWTVVCYRNNACRDFGSYNWASSSNNCFFNPDMSLETPELIKKYTGFFESYEITTEDGYILTIFRIRRHNARGTVLMQHPLITNSRIYVGQGNQSLAFQLWHSGFDVWLNNMRGTQFSERHLNLSTSDPEYWNFSLHEIGVYDVSAQINFMKSTTNDSQIIFISHSLGSSVGLIYSSLRSFEAQNSVKLFALISTPCYFKHSTSPAMMFQNADKLIEGIVKFLGLDRAMTSQWKITQFLKQTLKASPYLLYLVPLTMSYFSGWTINEADPALLNLDLPIYLKQFSWKTVLHYQQLSKSKTRFQMFDYGFETNQRIYGSVTPPTYPLWNISVPLFLISSWHDTLTSVKDADLLLSQVRPNVRKYGHLKIKGLNHFDIHFGKHRQEIFVDALLDFLTKI